MSMRAFHNPFTSQRWASTDQLTTPLIIPHKFLEPPVEREAKAENMPCLFNATWLTTMVCKNVPKDVGNDKRYGGLLRSGKDSTIRNRCTVLRDMLKRQAISRSESACCLRIAGKVSRLRSQAHMQSGQSTGFCWDTLLQPSCSPASAGLPRALLHSLDPSRLFSSCSTLASIALR
jgi:hypothetical protein